MVDKQSIPAATAHDGLIIPIKHGFPMHLDKNEVSINILLLGFTTAASSGCKNSNTNVTPSHSDRLLLQRGTRKVKPRTVIYRHAAAQSKMTIIAPGSSVADGGEHGYG